MSVLEPDEIVTAIKVPVTGADKTAYLKAGAAFFPASLVGRCRRAPDTWMRRELAAGPLSASPASPTRLTARIVSSKCLRRKIGCSADSASGGRKRCRNIEAIEDINGSAEYRKQLTEVYVTRAIEAALKG